MNFGTLPGGTQVESTTPVGGNGTVPGPKVTGHKHQVADLQTAKSRYQTGKPATADCWTGKDWKT